MNVNVTATRFPTTDLEYKAMPPNKRVAIEWNTAV